MATSTRTVEVTLSVDEAQKILAKEAQRVLGMGADKELPLQGVQFVIGYRSDGYDDRDSGPGIPEVQGIKVTFRR